MTIAATHSYDLQPQELLAYTTVNQPESCMTNNTSLTPRSLLNAIVNHHTTQ
ncbi:hypothetical protein F511_19930 [Dorcoceras hygrometricum]|uniref:Uncharacterized protein n=1 Tax=Dorcoceras hygrometricum TaxID=472368 RepID=A0A2Z7D9D9_9LAMI|nr:hypothetical protein F511_19930 [Dorcoceras hygrometricum]